MAGIRDAEDFTLKTRDNFQNQGGVHIQYQYGSSVHTDNPVLSQSRLSTPFPTPHRHAYSDPALICPDNERYAQLLMGEQRGYPLWIPEPNECLPAEYRQKGAEIGDVAVLTDDGMLDVLFNITRPPDDPVNVHYGVPEGFTPLQFPNSKKVERYHGDGHHVCRPRYGISKHSISEPLDRTESCHRSTVEFRSAPMVSEGAILVFPDGCSRMDLADTTLFLRQAIEHGASWFRHADSLGRTRVSQTATLYLVTGGDKASSFGMASILKHPEIPLSLSFVETVDQRGKTSYKWGSDPSCTTRCKPETRKILESNAPNDHENQSLFLRGFWLSRHEQASIKQSSPDRDASLKHEQQGLPGSDRNERRWRASSSLLSSHPQDTLKLTSSDSQLKSYHPCNDINHYLYETLRPSFDRELSVIVISHDEDWCKSNKTAPSYPLDPESIGRLCGGIHHKIFGNVIYTIRNVSEGTSLGLTTCGRLLSMISRAPAPSQKDEECAYGGSKRGSSPEGRSISQDPGLRGDSNTQTKAQSTAKRAPKDTDDSQSESSEADGSQIQRHDSSTDGSGSTSHPPSTDHSSGVKRKEREPSQERSCTPPQSSSADDSKGVKRQRRSFSPERKSGSVPQQDGNSSSSGTLPLGSQTRSSGSLGSIPQSSGTSGSDQARSPASQFLQPPPPGAIGSSSEGHMPRESKRSVLGSILDLCPTPRSIPGGFGGSNHAQDFSDSSTLFDSSTSCDEDDFLDDGHDFGGGDLSTLSIPAHPRGLTRPYHKARRLQNPVHYPGEDSVTSSSSGWDPYVTPPSLERNVALTPVLPRDHDTLQSSESSTQACERPRVANHTIIEASVRRRKYAPKFACDVQGCGQTFTARHNLTNHSNSHSGIKPYRCSFCDVRFTTRNQLEGGGESDDSSSGTTKNSNFTAHRAGGSQDMYLSRAIRMKLRYL
ncbi:hypothetical protein Moror_15372 [Moniliophthora roreri MCA 2997]|uniref:C2H2-type domain-containing protein n=1 Tax=Moniliophthora roreri (strain MCA 2997) TaxID=1381753 RepID=V2X1U6_MONRO|nr:hypothetical protein Moror_15372 [Moniliophthora roreri MCA 2997]